MKQKRELINKSIIYMKLSGVNKNLYFLEKVDRYTYRITTYAPISINDRLGYYFDVHFDNYKNIFPSYLISTKKYYTIQ